MDQFDPIVAAHKHCSNHREELLSSDLCGCFYCLEIYSPREILVWIDDGKCALCPKCGIDSVIGSASNYPITQEFLKSMNQHWF
jgi:hypothetical protein